MDTKQHGITVAVNANRSQMHRVPARLALLPQLLSRSAEKGRSMRSQRRIPRLAIHVRDHQHLGCLLVLYDGGDQPILAEAGLWSVAHMRTTTPWSRR